MKSFKYSSILWYINLICFMLIFTISWHLTDTHHLSFLLTKSNGVVRRARALKINQHREHHRWGPFFEESLNSTQNGEYLIQTAHLYTEAVLNCRVGMLKDKIVMWVKHSLEKVSLLTVGNITYSGDPRISVKFQYPNNWRLFINPIQKGDEGIYMCQVSTHPPRAFFTNLTIIEPPIRIIDEENEREVSDRFYKSGSTIKLQCQVSKNFLITQLKLCTTSTLKNSCKISTHQENVKMNVNSIQDENKHLDNDSINQKFYNISKAYIFWTKDVDLLPGTTVFNTSFSDKWFNTQFTIPEAKLSDSGNYTCSVGNIFSAIVQVQILTGELPAAVQHNGVYSLGNLKNSNYWPRILLFTLLQYMWNN